VWSSKMAFYNRKKVNYQEAQSHNPLVLSPSDNGVDWIMMKEYVYEVGKIGSGDEIKVPEGFITDFASIPRSFWSFLPPWGKYGKAAIVHDYLYDTAIRTRKDSDSIFLEIMKNSSVNTFIRYIIYYSVRMFGWIFYNRDNKSNQGNVSPQTQQHNENNTPDSKRSFWLVLIIGSTLTLISPWVFTQHWFGQFFKFGDATGPIGDTVGGLTAPIIGLMSAVLVYLTLHEQVKANGMQREAIAKQSQENILAHELAEIREGINTMEKLLRETNFTKNVGYGEIEMNLPEYLKGHGFRRVNELREYLLHFTHYYLILELYWKINKDKNTVLLNTVEQRLVSTYTIFFRNYIPKFLHLCEIGEIVEMHDDIVNKTQKDYEEIESKLASKLLKL